MADVPRPYYCEAVDDVGDSIIYIITDGSPSPMVVSVAEWETDFRPRIEALGWSMHDPLAERDALRTIADAHQHDKAEMQETLDTLRADQAILVQEVEDQRATAMRFAERYQEECRQTETLRTQRDEAIERSRKAHQTLEEVEQENDTLRETDTEMKRENRLLREADAILRTQLESARQEIAAHEEIHAIDEEHHKEHHEREGQLRKQLAAVQLEAADERAVRHAAERECDLFRAQLVVAEQELEKVKEQLWDATHPEARKFANPPFPEDT